MVKISFIEVTARPNFPYAGKPDVHLWEPTLQTLAKQTFKDFEYIAIDIFYDERPDYFKTHNYGLKIKHVPAAPSVWHDLGICQICHQFNKGIIHAEGQLLFFCADSNMHPPWLFEQLWRRYQEGWFVSLGFGADVSYGPKYLQDTAHDNIVPTDWYRFLEWHGHVHMDHRYNKLFENTTTQSALIPPSWYYGISTASLEAMLKINGFDEAFDGDGCFTAGQIVNGRIAKPIEEVQEGDMVLTHKGRFRKVLKTHKRWHKGQIITFDVLGGSPISVTGGHVLPVRKTKSKGKNNSIGTRLVLSETVWDSARGIAEDWKNEIETTNSLRQRQQRKSKYRLIFSAPKTAIWLQHVKLGKYSIPLTPDLAYFVGVYLAEGSTSRRYLDFSLNENEEKIANKLISIYNKDLGFLKRRLPNTPHGAITCDKSRHAMKVSFSVGEDFATLWKEWLGADCYTKNIPCELCYNANLKIVKALVTGMWDGDGSGIHYTTASFQMANSLQMALARLGQYARLDTVKKNQGGFTSNHPSYRLQLIKSIRKTSHMLDNRGLFFYRPIREINVTDYEGYVYHLTVEEDKTYHVNAIAVHNSLNDIDVGNRLTLAGYNKLAMFRDCFVIEAYAGSEWHPNMKRPEIKCNNALLHFNRLMKRQRANIGITPSDLDWIRKEVCYKACEVKDTCRTLPHRGPFHNKNELPLWNHWKQYAMGHQVDLEMEREMRQSGDDYTEGTFINVE